MRARKATSKTNRSSVPKRRCEPHHGETESDAETVQGNSSRQGVRGRRQEKSQIKAVRKGWHLGTVVGQTEPEFEAAAFALKEGSQRYREDAIRYHILKVAALTTVQPFEE